MSFIKNVIVGAIIGVANIIPGVSGGTYDGNSECF